MEFTGWQSQENLAKISSKASVLVAPSLWRENSPLTVYEALAIGLPIVGSNRGGISELIVDKVSGYVVDPLDSDALADRIIDILSDPELASKFATEGLIRYKKYYSPEAYYKNLISVYRR